MLYSFICSRMWSIYLNYAISHAVHLRGELCSFSMTSVILDELIIFPRMHTNLDAEARVMMDACWISMLLRE